MSTSQKIREQLVKQQAKITDLESRRDAIFQELESLEIKLAAAEEAFSQGDESQAGVIERLKDVMAPLESKMRGFDSQVERERNEEGKLSAALKQALEEEAAALEAHLSRKREEKILDLIRQAEPRGARMKELWLEFNVLLAERMTTEAMIGDHPGKPKHNPGFMAEVVNFPETQGYRKCLQPGYNGQWSPWAVTKGDRNPHDEAQRREEADRAAWTEEWKREQGL